MGQVIIGMDPHKRSATIEIIDEREAVLAAGRFGTDRDGYRAMLALGRRYPDRVWAVEGCNTDLINRIHKLLLELLPGGAKTFLSAAQARALLNTIRPRDLVGRTRRRLASELVTELVQVDKKIKTANQELTELVKATGSGLQELNGIGPSGAARLIGDIGDIHRFTSRGHFASWNGTAPLDASSGEQQRHRLSRAGNRRINRVLHIMAVVQLRHDTEGRAYYRRKLAAGKTPMEAMRALKRRLSDVVYRRMLTDAKKAATGPGGLRQSS